MSEEKKALDEMEQQPLTEEPETEAEAPPTDEEEHGHANYLFAFKVIAVLIAIILIIVILKASGVPVAIRDWFRDRSAHSILTSFLPFLK